MTVAAHRRLLHLALAGAVLGALLGCGSSDFTDPDHVRTWANTASAVAVYVHADQPVAFADKQHTFKDASCPSTTDDGTTVTIGGECLDSTGRQWLGQATVVRSGTGDKDLTLKGYGSFNDPNMKAVTDGTVQLRRLNDTLHTFNVDLVKKGGMTTTIQYNGEVQGGYDAPTTWSGSGSVQRQGLVAPTGTVQATTVKPMITSSTVDKACIESLHFCSPLHCRVVPPSAQYQTTSSQDKHMGTIPSAWSCIRMTSLGQAERECNMPRRLCTFKTSLKATTKIRLYGALKETLLPKGLLRSRSPVSTG